MSHIEGAPYLLEERTRSPSRSLLSFLAFVLLLSAPVWIPSVNVKIPGLPVPTQKKQTEEVLMAQPTLPPWIKALQERDP